AVILEPVGRCSYPRRHRHNAADPRPAHARASPYPSRPRLVHDPNRGRQRLQPRDRLAGPRRPPQRPHLTAPYTKHAPDHRPSAHIKSDPGPIPTATRANPRARRRALHTVSPSPSVCRSGPVSYALVGRPGLCAAARWLRGAERGAVLLLDEAEVRVLHG